MGLGSFRISRVSESGGRLASISGAGDRRGSGFRTEAECPKMGLGSFGIPSVGGSGRRPLVGETDESVGEKSWLKFGCTQDWLPHKDDVVTNTRLLHGELVSGVSDI